MFWTGLSCSAFDSPGISMDLQPALPCSRYQSRPASHVQVDHRHRCCWCHRRASTNHTCHEQSWRQSKTLRKNEARNHENHEKPVVKPDGIPMVSGCFWMFLECQCIFQPTKIQASYRSLSIPNRHARKDILCRWNRSLPGIKILMGIDSLICRCILSVQHAACIATTFPKHPQSPSATKLSVGIVLRYPYHVRQG